MDRPIRLIDGPIRRDLLRRPGASPSPSRFLSLTEVLDLTTPAGRAMAGLVAVFAEFEREILRARVG